jgi:hypothetical protein
MKGAIVRHTPLKRCSLKQKRIKFSFSAKCEVARPKRTRLRQRSPKKAADDLKYAQAKVAYINRHPRCQHPDGCTRSLSKGHQMDLHHRAGRNGPLLYCARYFATACRQHHDLAKTQISSSRANGWIVDVSSEEVRALRTAEILSN